MSRGMCMPTQMRPQATGSPRKASTRPAIRVGQPDHDAITRCAANFRQAFFRCCAIGDRECGLVFQVAGSDDQEGNFLAA